MTILNPSHVDWLLSHGDTSMGFIGWHFFRNDLWRFPIGLNWPYGMEIGSSIVYSDSIPLLAIFFKIIDFILPEKFQYFGVWLLICFCLQAFFSMRLISIYTNNIFIKIFFAILCTTMPAFLWRLYGHLALLGHWLIISALYLYFSYNKDGKCYAIGWIILISLSSLVHFYLMIMVFSVWVAYIVQTYINQGKIQFKEIAITMICLVATMWQAGYFAIESGQDAGGFGYYRMNVLSPIDPDNWSRFLPDIPQASGDYEGFNYLGVGLILLCVFSIISLIRKPITKKSILSYSPIILICFLLLSVAVSNNIGFMSKTLVELPVCPKLLALMGIVRASGRFFWPITYLIALSATCILITRYDKKVAILILSLCTSLQIIDTSSGWNSLKEIYNKHWNKGFVSPFSSGFWQEAFQHYDKLITIPAMTGLDFLAPSYLAALHKIQTNAAKFARIDEKKLASENSKLFFNIIDSKFDPTALYIIQDNDLFKFMQLMDSQNHYVVVDGMKIIVTDWRECSLCANYLTSKISLKLYEANTTLSCFNINTDNTGYLLLGWTEPGPPDACGIWSWGNFSAIVLRINHVTEDLELVIEGDAFPKNSQEINLTVDNENIGLLKYHQGNDHEDKYQSFHIPFRLIEGKEYLLIKFTTEKPVSPKALGINEDSRLLGFFLKSFSLRTFR